jgi:cytochrome subunit of sulfide dehydrogenase
MSKKETASVMSVAGLFCALMFVGNTWAADVNKLVEECVDCHGKDGASKESEVPIIGGFSAQYIIDSMTAYRKKERPCPETKYHEGKKKDQKTDMCKEAKELSAEDVKTVAKHFAGKKFVRAKQKFDPGKAKVGEKIHGVECKKCHENGGSSPDDDAGILAGQWAPYLKQTFDDYMSGKRPQPDKMKVKMDKLNKGEIDALIHYYASIQ